MNAFWVRNDILECQGVPLPTLEQTRRQFAGHLQESDPTHQWLYLDESLNVVKKEFQPW